MQDEIESPQKAKKNKAFHLIVAGYRLPMYWMHLEVAAGTTLAILDRFLRDTWLECCGHLSVFRIGGCNYYVDAEMDAYWDTRRKNMQVKLEEVLSPGQTCSYEYDFGSTTELIVKVLAEQELVMKGKAIQVLARNTLPIIPCDGCGGPATHICTQCIYEDKGCLCDTCARSHETLLRLMEGRVWNVRGKSAFRSISSCGSDNDCGYSCYINNRVYYY